MPLYHASTIQWPVAVQSIADSAGASADSEMLGRAHLSLRAAFQHFNSKAKWNFLRAEAAPLSVVAPFTVTGVTASGGSASAAAPVGHGVTADDLLIGTGFLLGTRVTATAAGVLGFNAAITGFTGTAVVTVTAQRDMYDLPSDYRDEYTLKMLASNITLKYVGRRTYDRIAPDENQGSTPYRYDLFPVGAKGKLRLLRPPVSSDILQNRYYRRMFLASASGVASAIDIPEDYESYPIAWAKWHFLTDKGEGRKDQATVWLSLAQEGLKTMLADQTDIQDEQLEFVPDHMLGVNETNPNSTRLVPWDF